MYDQEEALRTSGSSTNVSGNITKSELPVITQDQYKAIYEIVSKEIAAHKIPQVAYPSVRPFNFSEAFQHLKAGRHVARHGWNGMGMYLGICEGGGFRDGFRTQDFIYMKTADDMIVPWGVSQTDIFANDWRVVD